MIFSMFSGCSECTLQFTDCCLSSSLCSGLTDGLLHALGDQWHPNPHSHSCLALGSTAAAQTINNPSYRLISLPLVHNKYPFPNSINISFPYTADKGKAVPLLNDHATQIYGRMETAPPINVSNRRKQVATLSRGNSPW